MIEKRLYQAGERFISRTRWKTTRYTLADAGVMGKYLIGDGDKQKVWRINHTKTLEPESVHTSIDWRI